MRKIDRSNYREHTSLWNILTALSLLQSQPFAAPKRPSHLLTPKIMCRGGGFRTHLRGSRRLWCYAHTLRMRNDPSLREIFACQSNIFKWIRYAVDDAKIYQAAYESVAVQLEGYGEKSFYLSNAFVSGAMGAFETSPKVWKVRGRSPRRQLIPRSHEDPSLFRLILPDRFFHPKSRQGHYSNFLKIVLQPIC